MKSVSTENKPSLAQNNSSASSLIPDTDSAENIDNTTVDLISFYDDNNNNSANAAEAAAYNSKALDEYFAILDKLYKLTIQINSVSSDAALLLAKANYVSFGGKIKRFGQDFYDYRDRTATLTIDEAADDDSKKGIFGSPALRVADSLAFDEDHVKQTVERQVINSFSEDVTVKENESNLTNRHKQEEKKQKNDFIDNEVSKRIKQIKKEKKKQNPIRMFNGGLVPRELSQSQQLNLKLVSLLVEYANARSTLNLKAHEIKESTT